MGAIEFHPDLIRFAFVLGIALSIMFYDRTFLTTGGIAVPAYLSFTVFLPFIALAVLIVAFATYLIVYRLLPRFLILTNSGQFSVAVLVSAGLHLVIDIAMQASGLGEPTSPLLRGIGYVVPGLIAHDLARHGIAQSAASIIGTSLIVACALVLTLVGIPDTSRFYNSPVTDAFPVDLALIPLLVFLSLLGWLGVARVRDLRCGGILGGAYMALFVMQPLELAVFWMTAALTVLIVEFCIAPITIIFGRRKFAAHMLVGACLAWAVLKIREQILADPTISVVTPSLAILGVLLTGLLANDMDRVGVVRTLAGSILSVIFTLAGTLLIVELFTFQRADWIVPLGLVVACGALVLFFETPNRPRGNTGPDAAAANHS